MNTNTGESDRMTHLLHLSSETLVQIIDYLDPRSIQSLSLCNKFICEVAEEKPYASIGIHDIGLRAEIAFHPLVLLHKILTSSRFAVYPRTLIFDRWSDQSGYDEVAINEDLGYDICTMLWSYGYLKTEDIADWYEKTKADRNESPHHQPWGPVIAILVKLLPNVQCIEVHDEGMFASVVRELVGSASEDEGRQYLAYLGWLGNLGA